MLYKVFSDVQLLVIMTSSLAAPGSSVNVASLAGGASCNASSEWDDNYPCWDALDGDISDPESMWSSSYLFTPPPDVASWIKITFDAIYRVTTARFLETPEAECAARDMLLTFSGGHSTKVIFCPNGFYQDMETYIIYR